MEVGRARVAIVGATIAWGVNGCFLQGKSCTEIGCLDGVQITGPMSTSPDTIVVTLCLNGRCGTSSAIARNGSGLVQGDLAFLVSRTAPADVLSINLDTAFNGLMPRDGDVLDLTIVDGATQSPIEMRSWTLEYQKVQPNGHDCPPTCHTAELELGK